VADIARFCHQTNRVFLYLYTEDYIILSPLTYGRRRSVAFWERILHSCSQTIFYDANKLQNRDRLKTTGLVLVNIDGRCETMIYL